MLESDLDLARRTQAVKQTEQLEDRLKKVGWLHISLS